ncbi:hypothetical protein LINPERHAP1_LOCUS7587, partial [Linum perenne]
AETLSLSFSLFFFLCFSHNFLLSFLSSSIFLFSSLTPKMVTKNKLNTYTLYLMAPPPPPNTAVAVLSLAAITPIRLAAAVAAPSVIAVRSRSPPIRLVSKPSSRRAVVAATATEPLSKSSDLPSRSLRRHHRLFAAAASCSSPCYRRRAATAVNSP